MQSNVSAIIHEFKDSTFHIDSCQREYYHKVGLSTHRTLIDDQSIDLPLHPRALQNELSDYKDHFKTLKRQFIEQEAKEAFLKHILHDPPLPITDKHIHELDEECKSLKRELENIKNDHQTQMTEVVTLISSIEHLRRTMQQQMDDVAWMLDDYRDKAAQLTRIETLLQHQFQYSPEEAKAILERQVEDIRRIECEINAREEEIEDLRWHVETTEQRLEELVMQVTDAEREASEAVRRYESKDPAVEERTKWYTAMTEICNTLFGIDRIEFISNTTTMIYFSTPYTAQLRIEVDLLSHHIAKATLDPPSVNIDELVRMSHECLPKDAIALVVLETLARLKRENRRMNGH